MRELIEEFKEFIIFMFCEEPFLGFMFVAFCFFMVVGTVLGCDMSFASNFAIRQALMTSVFY